MIPVVAGPDHNWRHIGLVNVPCRLLLYFDCATDNDIVSVDEVTLAEELGLGGHLGHQLGDLDQFRGDAVGVLHEEAEAFAGGQLAPPNGAKFGGREPLRDALAQTEGG